MAEISPNKKSGDPRGERTVTFLDHALWRQLLEAENDQVFCSSWLALQAKIMSGAHSGMVVFSSTETGPFVPVAIWPTDSNPTNLAKVTERALQEKKGVVVREDLSESDSGPSTHYNIAYPVKRNDVVVGAASFVVETQDPDNLSALMRQLQWGTAWLENRVLRREVGLDGRMTEKITAALDLAAVAIEKDKFDGAALSFVTLMANRFMLHRASLGFVKGKHIRVRAVSHSSQFKKDMNLITAIAAAMEESIDQQMVVAYPESAAENQEAAMRRHAHLSTIDNNASICTIPLRKPDGMVYGALTLERPFESPFAPEEVDVFSTIAALVGPILDEKRKNDRLLIFKAAESCHQQAKKLFGPGHLTYKLIASLLAILIVVFSIVDGTFRVTAKTNVEGAVQRAIVAPFDGYIADAKVRAGDVVAEGQVICSLEDKDLRLQRLKWESEREQYTRQYREALANADRATMRVVRQQVQQAEAQVRLLDEQITRSRLVSPFRGVVVSGDLSQSLGAPVERGKILFEVAPLRDYRVKLHVDEHDITYVKLRQKGDLVLNSIPDVHFPVTISKITPVSASEEGKSHFLVEAELENPSERLRPGMEGFAKVTIGERKLIWIWVHDLITWVRLWVWSWWP